MDLADVIRLNQLVRGRIDFDGFGRWFDSLSPAQRVALADTVFGYAHQAGLTDPVFDEAVRAAGLPTDHPVVRRLWDARRGRDFEYLFHPDRFLTPLDEADRRTACRFFVALFGTAEGRRLCRPEWADSCNHWWHRDLLDRRVVDDLLNNPQYASTSMRDDARLFPCLTEHEWLSGTDPWRMFEFVRGKAGDRKLRLLACAWVGRLGGDSSVVSWGEVREAAYRLADGCDGRRDAPDFDREALWAARSLKEEWGRRVAA